MGYVPLLPFLNPIMETKLPVHLSFRADEQPSLETVIAIAQEHGRDFPGMTAGQVRDAIEAIRTRFGISPVSFGLKERGDGPLMREELHALIEIITGRDPNLMATGGDQSPESGNISAFEARAPQYPGVSEIAITA